MKCSLNHLEFMDSYASMVILIWYLSCGLMRLVSVGCFALELTLTHRHGPEMCERLQKRGCDVTFHRENLTCVIHDESSKLKATRGQCEANCTDLKKAVTARRPQLYISGEASGRSIIQKQDLRNPHEAFQFTVGKSCEILELICSQKKDKVFFIALERENTKKATLTSMNMYGKQKKLMRIGIGEIAVDDEADFLFMTRTVRQNRIRQCKLEQMDLRKLKRLRTIITFKNLIYGLEIDAKRQLIFFHCSRIIYFGKYEGNFRNVYFSVSKISSIAYERVSKLLYFLEGRSLRSLSSVGGIEAKFVMKIKDDQLPFKIYKQLLFVPNRKRDELEVINVTSGISHFHIPSLSGRINFCIMD